MRLGVLVSGRGSNLEAVLDAHRDGRLVGIEPALIVSNRPGVRALEVADRHASPHRVLERRAFADAGARDGAIGHAFEEARCDLVLLAGYDQRLRDPYFAAYHGPTINIHPSLLPRHGGAGMMGLAVHQSVLDAGDVESGVSIHLVTRNLDAGPVLVQVHVPVVAGDDAESLARRVLEVEHRLLVEMLAGLAARGLPDLASASMTDRPVTVEAD
jgi:formyltetrahydrofolate-dependent phosphoribosylglycinamide formyltransferase